MNDTTHAPDRHETEKSLASIRTQVAKAREGLDRLKSNQRHLFRTECVLLSLQDQPGEDPENVHQQLIETRTELDAIQAKINAAENEIENLQAAALEHIERIEVHRRLPGIVRDLSVLWACRASRGNVAPSLPSYAADLLRERLQTAGKQVQSGEINLDGFTRKLKRAHKI